MREKKKTKDQNIERVKLAVVTDPRELEHIIFHKVE